MRMKRWALPLMGITLAVAGWLLFQSSSRGPDQDAPNMGPLDTTAGETFRQNAAMAVLPPLPEGPFAHVRNTLEARAQAGDAEAAYRLGNVIGQCRTYQPIPDTAFAVLLARFAAMGDSVRMGGRPVDDDLNLDAMLERKQELDDLCDGTDDLATTADVDAAHAWLARAAEQGHALAMVHYADHAFAAFPTHADLLENAEEVVRRRERARLWMHRAFELGEVESLYALSVAYSPNGILGDDPVRALAYLQAYRDSGSARAATARLGDALLREHAGPEQIEQAAVLSSHITGAFRNRRPAP